MSSEHKAFVFDYFNFELQLKDILESSLINDDSSALSTYIMQNLSYLKDPYEGETLDDNWESMLETQDVHQYGDFALTKFYNPQEDIGVGYEWADLHNFLSHKPGCENIILGLPIGSDGNYFDPGKLGSYFQTSNEVKKNLRLLEDIIEKDPESTLRLEGISKMLQSAGREDKGLYVTF
jgi:hypothetical protein